MGPGCLLNTSVRQLEDDCRRGRTQGVNMAKLPQLPRFCIKLRLGELTNSLFAYQEKPEREKWLKQRTG